MSKRLTRVSFSCLVVFFDVEKFAAFLFFPSWVFFSTSKSLTRVSFPCLVFFDVEKFDACLCFLSWFFSTSKSLTRVSFSCLGFFRRRKVWRVSLLPVLFFVFDVERFDACLFFLSCGFCFDVEKSDACFLFLSWFFVSTSKSLMRVYFSCFVRFFDVEEFDACLFFLSKDMNEYDACPAGKRILAVAVAFAALFLQNGFRRFAQQWL